MNGLLILIDLAVTLVHVDRSGFGVSIDASDEVLLFGDDGGETLEHASNLGESRLHAADLLSAVLSRARGPQGADLQLFSLAPLVHLPGRGAAPHVNGHACSWSVERGRAVMILRPSTFQRPSLCHPKTGLTKPWFHPARQLLHVLPVADAGAQISAGG